MPRPETVPEKSEETNDLSIAKTKTEPARGSKPKEVMTGHYSWNKPSSEEQSPLETTPTKKTLGVEKQAASTPVKPSSMFTPAP